MTLTNKGLVEFAKDMLALGDDTVYVYGTFGRTLTESLINQKAKQYLYNLPRKALYKRIMQSKGTEYAFDCVGLIKAYLFRWNGGKTLYIASQDVSANGMLAAAKVKGKIATMPMRTGLLVHMKGHIGILVVENGEMYVIECTPTKKYAKQSHGGGGVCKTKLSDRKWTSWLECPFIDYIDEEEKEEKKDTSFFPARGYFKKGDVSANVGKIAEFMRKMFPSYTSKKALGNTYGPYLIKAITTFQKRTGLEADGCVGPLTLAELEKYGFKY